jgi:hypothetical protein
VIVTAEFATYAYVTPFLRNVVRPELIGLFLLILRRRRSDRQRDRRHDGCKQPQGHIRHLRRADRGCDPASSGRWGTRQRERLYC